MKMTAREKKKRLAFWWVYNLDFEESAVHM